MIEFYTQIKFVHVATASLSGVLFALRALGTQLLLQWPMAAPVRYLSYSVDTVLLTSAMMLMSVVHQFPLVNSWLTLKLGLVVLYIVFGSLALGRAKGQRLRAASAIAAMSVFGLIVSVARTHSPAGILAWLRP